jgi:hypothetical protein
MRSGWPPGAAKSWESWIMVRRVRSFTAWFLAAALGGMSFVGEGLHELACADHGAAGHAHRFAAPLLTRDTLSPPKFRSSGQQQQLVAAGRSDHHDAATCPICQFLAQARLIAERFEAAPALAPVPSQTYPAPVVVATSALKPYGARAPPTV